MIGEYIRGYHHLLRKCQNEPLKLICRRKDSRIYLGEIILDKNNNQVIFFQNLFGNVSPSIDNNIYLDLKCRYNNCCIINNDDIMSKLGDEFILAPKQINEDYIKFIGQNKKRFSNLPSVGLTDGLNLYIYIQSNSSPNLFHWALTNFYKEQITIFSIKHIMFWANTYPQLIQFLKKKTITAYNGYESISKLEEEMTLLQKRKRVNDVINMFNTAQKKILKQIEINDDITNVFSKFFVLSDTKKNNFIRKVSTFDSANDIINNMKLLVKTHFSWDINSFKEFITNNDINCNIILEKDNLIIVEVSDYDTIKHIAKTTNWCISKNKKYWNDYVERYNGLSKQYILLDFSKEEDDELSIVGFTVIDNNGIKHAHSFTNNNLIGEKTQTSLNSFKPKNNNIYDILTSYGIDPNIWLSCIDSRYEWTKDGFMNYISKNNYNFDIICNENSKIALITDDIFLISNLTPNNNNFNPKSKFLVFANFCKTKNDPNRIIIALIEKSYVLKDEVPRLLLNYIGDEISVNNFENLLNDFSLPYNTIKRSKNILSYFLNMIRSFNVKEINNLLFNDELIEKLIDKKDQNSNFLTEKINYSIFHLSSNDLLKTIYSHINLSEIIRQEDLNGIIYSLISQIMDIYYDHNCDPFENKKELKYPYEYLQRGYLEALRLILSDKNIVINRHLINEIYYNREMSFIIRELSKLILPSILLHNTSTRKLLDVIIVNNEIDIMQQLFLYMNNENKDFICEYMTSHLSQSHIMYNEFKKFHEETVAQYSI